MNENQIETMAFDCCRSRNPGFSLSKCRCRIFWVATRSQYLTHLSDIILKLIHVEHKWYQMRTLQWNWYRFYSGHWNVVNIVHNNQLLVLFLFIYSLGFWSLKWDTFVLYSEFYMEIKFNCVWRVNIFFPSGYWIRLLEMLLFYRMTSVMNCSFFCIKIILR